MIKYRIVVIGGPSGVGKTTIGKLLGSHFSADDAIFLDADDFHSPENKAKMAAGTPLRDEDRLPWLLRLATVLTASPTPVILACSALKEEYRDILRSSCQPGFSTGFIMLTCERSTLEKRLVSRSGHFMPPALLDSQLESLELSCGDTENDMLILDADTLPPPPLVKAIIDFIVE